MWAVYACRRRRPLSACRSRGRSVLIVLVSECAECAACARHTPEGSCRGMCSALSTVAWLVLWKPVDGAGELFGVCSGFGAATVDKRATVRAAVSHLWLPQGFSSPLTAQGGSHAQRHCRRWTCSSSRPLSQHPLVSLAFIRAAVDRSEPPQVVASEAVPVRSERHTVRGRATAGRRSRRGARAYTGSRGLVRAGGSVPLRRRRVAVVCLREEARRRRMVSVASRFRQTTTATHVDTGGSAQVLRAPRNRAMQVDHASGRKTTSPPRA
jgi:hypothetical protein